ncbi:TIGR01841 family phasin [Hephaestia sp. GCM10023244]|uniref:TIGR01841 family phasin n=1 Tax=unclassified Hephaestia TaxID=2631281 RepID=UPI002077962D|nr:TIGR01841 family phasin [Hephaestia sp. MAHUQ-44]MCM8731929.1 TIGR01841 family phasin [Hephaestia sp. MAHUQ-44]
MAEAKKPGAKKSGATGPRATGRASATDPSGIADKVRAAGEKMRASGERIAGHGNELGMKLLDQAEQNTREAFEAMRRAAKAHDLSEVMHVQGEYLREQGSRSLAQAREIGEMIANFGRDAINRVAGRDDTK